MTHWSGQTPADRVSHNELKSANMENIQRCTRCTYDATVPLIRFDEDGVCNYCGIHDDLCLRYPVGEEGEKRLRTLADEIKQSARGKKYDCIVGVSGGCDSSYLVVRLVELGLKPLAVHFDNTWNSETATQNIYKVLEKLDVDLYTYVVDSREFDDILRSFMLAGTNHVNAATDLGLASVLYAAAARHGLKYVIEGHSFRTEGIAPLNWSYMDGRYIESIHRMYGRLPMRTFPNMSLSQFVWYTAVKGIRRVRPLYNMSYPKEDAKKMLRDRFGWEWYGGHHLENRFVAFAHLHIFPQRWNYDLRQLGHAALVRSGQLERTDALELLKQPVESPQELTDLVKKRLALSDEEFNRIMRLPKRTWHDFPTYKKSFERLRPLFKVLVKMGRVPESFYIKFCFPNQLGESGEN